MRQLLQGDVIAALWFNPLITLLAFAAFAWGFYACAVLVFRLPRLRVGEVSRSCALALRIGVAAAVLANWWWVIAHDL